MHILTAEQMRAWDRYTIEHEPITSTDLMERAATTCVDWLLAKPWQGRPFYVFCGRGNNGGDGLAIARQLAAMGCVVQVFVLYDDKPGSSDFELNLERLKKEVGLHGQLLKSATDLTPITENAIVVDALFGFGLNKPLQGLAAQVVQHINSGDAITVSIDLPSGLALDHSSLGQPVAEADFTLTFEAMKQALLLQENAAFVGEVEVLNIGLLSAFLNTVPATDIYLDEKYIQQLYKTRKRFAHKGNYGHAAIIGGSWGKMGAVVLSANACLRTGAGLTTAVVPKCGYAILQSSLPEVMVMAEEEERELATLPADLEKFGSIGIGPGMGTSQKSIQFLIDLLQRYRKPMVIDADGLNCLAKSPALMQQLPSHSILTPHPKEFERLFGEHKSDFDRVATAQAKAKELNVIIVLKGHHSLIALPDGRSFYNSTGNAGMAKGGSGDVLTGILTSLLSQGYSPAEAAQLGVYIHGWAGDSAAKKFSKEAMTPGDLSRCLGEVFLQLAALQNEEC